MAPAADFILVKQGSPDGNHGAGEGRKVRKSKGCSVRGKQCNTNDDGISTQPARWGGNLARHQIASKAYFMPNGAEYIFSMNFTSNAISVQ